MLLAPRTSCRLAGGCVDQVACLDGTSKHCGVVELFAQRDRCLSPRCCFLLQLRLQRAADLKPGRPLDLDSVVIKCGSLTDIDIVLRESTE